MCGICGIYSNKNENNNNFQIKKMLSLLQHRGPDGEGQWNDDKINMGHRRLSIVDLREAGNQPFLNEKKDVVLVCNGEIYNAKSLRKNLIKKGHSFISKSDNEVIVHLYEEMGIDLVDQLIGMYAFAIWDKKKETLFLARDRIGEKPIYYSHQNGVFYFSSEIKPIMEVWNQSPDLAENTFSNFLGLDSMPAPYTSFKNIYSLPPASILKFNSNNIKVYKYWKLNFLNAQKKWNYDDAISEFKFEIERAVKYTSISDLEVGLLLSGGVDSSIIASILQNKKNNNQKSFCISNNNVISENIEMERSSKVAQNFGFKHTNHMFDINEIIKLPKIIHAYEQPISSFPALFTDNFMQSISKELKVVLSGNGADEVFLGYNGYQRSLLKSNILNKVSKNKITNLTAKLFLKNNKIISKLIDNPFQEWKSILFKNNVMNIATKLLDKDYLSKFEEYIPFEMYAKTAKECNPRDYLDVLSYTDLMITHQHGTNLIPDISGMSYGVEIRSPFLNHKLIEFAASLPRNLLIPSQLRAKTNKFLLKKYLEPHLSKEIIYAKKVGFGFDINYHQLIKGPWNKIISKYVINGNFLKSIPINKNYLRSDNFENVEILWKLLSFSLWHDIFLLRKNHNDISEDFKFLINTAR